MIKNGWYCCPYCGKKLFPVEPDTTAHNLPQRCKACKRQLYAVSYTHLTLPTTSRV